MRPSLPLLLCLLLHAPPRAAADGVVCQLQLRVNTTELLSTLPTAEELDFDLIDTTPTEDGFLLIDLDYFSSIDSEDVQSTAELLFIGVFSGLFGPGTVEVEQASACTVCDCGTDPHRPVYGSLFGVAAFIVIVLLSIASRRHVWMPGGLVVLLRQPAAAAPPPPPSISVSDVSPSPRSRSARQR